ncbi:alginate lyase family protein [Streptomyces sp. NPDC046261]|uniref:alginate lyase family protein n=1 Tax=Streptomyces sp. NPDC046261 TaxID=3157200 RepID=UPI0033EEE501
MPGPCRISSFRTGPSRTGLLIRISLAAALLALLTPLIPVNAPAAPAGTAIPVAAPPRHLMAGRFTHPGVLVSREQLEEVRVRATGRAEPWRSAFRSMRDSAYGSLSYTAAPTSVVSCPTDSRPGRGCVEERKDAIAAYTHALLWYITDDRAHARKAVQIMDAWSAVVDDHTEGNAALQAAWAGTSWARAAEIMRYTYDDWPPGRVRRFATMLRTVYLPRVAAGAPDHNGNWELTMTDATMAIAVFLDDHAAFEDAVDRFRARVPAYFYLSTDGRLPRRPPGSRIGTAAEVRAYWFGQRRFVDGLAQETCRNFTHVGYGLAATGHIAETAWHQGVDLYAEAGRRLRAALAFHAGYQLGDAVPSWLCDGRLSTRMGPDTEVLLNHLTGREGVAIPDAQRVAELRRQAGRPGTDGLFVAWETLTHAGNPG